MARLSRYYDKTIHIIATNFLSSTGARTIAPAKSLKAMHRVTGTFVDWTIPSVSQRGA